jgi:hypothetical protein
MRRANRWLRGLSQREEARAAAWVVTAVAGRKEKRWIFVELSGSRSHGRDSFIHSVTTHP